MGPTARSARTRATRSAPLSGAGATQAVVRTAPPQAAKARPLSIMGIPEAELTPRVRKAIRNLMRDVDRLSQQVAQQAEALRTLERLADQDAMVPVANRRAFLRELARMISFAERYDQPFSLIFLDINNLKQINDRLGHAAGDAVIRHVAAALTANVRESDLVGRLGGDEFGVLLNNTDLPAAEAKAAALASVLDSRPLAWDGASVPVQVAFGCHTCRGGADAASVLGAADRAMYCHKMRLRSAP